MQFLHLEIPKWRNCTCAIPPFRNSECLHSLKASHEPPGALPWYQFPLICCTVGHHFGLSWPPFLYIPRDHHVTMTTAYPPPRRPSHPQESHDPTMMTTSTPHVPIVTLTDAYHMRHMTRPLSSGDAPHGTTSTYIQLLSFEQHIHPPRSTMDPRAPSINPTSPHAYISQRTCIRRHVMLCMHIHIHI